MSTPRAIIYRRVSTDEQAESGAGLAAQLDACRLAADRLGLAVAGPFDDEGVSGAADLDDRPGLLAAVADLARGDVLLVAKRDRLGRDVVGVALIEAAVGRRGARVASAAGEGTDGDDPGSLLMRRLIDSFAEYERLVIKARTLAALQAKKRRGERTGSVPYGFALADDGRRSRSGRPLALVPEPDEQRAIATMRAWRAGLASYREIAAGLTRMGIPPRAASGRPWAPQTVKTILDRPPEFPCPPTPSSAH